MDPSNPSLTAEALYTSLVESLPLNIFQKDRQFRIVSGNRRFCAALQPATSRGARDATPQPAFHLDFRGEIR